MSRDRTSNINDRISFASGHIPELLRKLENFLGVALALRSSTGEVVCKTDYLYGPCSIIRATERGNYRCRKTYKNIENHLLRRKAPFVNLCYAGFLIFSVPLEFRGEMLGTLLAPQILPMEKRQNLDLENLFGHTALALGISNTNEFYHSFSKIISLRPDFQRQSFLEYLSEVGDHFINMAFADKSWDQFLKEMRTRTPNFGCL